MTTITILKMGDKRKILDDNMLPYDPQIVAALNAAEQAVLQSPEVQRLREDAARWKTMKEQAVVTFMNDPGRKLMIATIELDRFPETLSMESFIDAAMKEQP